MTRDPAHIVVLSARLANERARLAAARSPAERELRAVWVRQIEKELAHEGVDPTPIVDMSDDDLLAELSA